MYLRWLLVLPLGFAGFLIGFLSVLALTNLVVRLCPAELLVSGACTAPWASIAEAAALCFGAGVGAFFAVTLPAVVAPSRKSQVALAALLLGGTYAVWLLVSVGTSFMAPFATSIALGLVALRLVRARAAHAP